MDATATSSKLVRPRFRPDLTALLRSDISRFLIAASPISNLEHAFAHGKHEPEGGSHDRDLIEMLHSRPKGGVEHQDPNSQHE